MVGRNHTNLQRKFGNSFGVSIGLLLPGPHEVILRVAWLRHTLNFRRGTDRENGKYLTQFMRAVRKSLNERASKRGRPIEIAVRIPERVEWCLEGGFEIPTWISEDLVDFLILGQGLTELPNLKEFKTLMKTNRGISQYRGQWLEYRNSKLLATYHPAYLLRNPNAKGEVWKDLQKVMAVLGLRAKGKSA